MCSGDKLVVIIFLERWVVMLCLLLRTAALNLHAAALSTIAATASAMTNSTKINY